MEFRILGPLEAGGGRAARSPSAAKQRALLAMLLMPRSGSSRATG